MTAEEIRKEEGVYRITSGGCGSRETIERGSQAWFLREIASQLAELNETLKTKQTDIRAQER